MPITFKILAGSLLGVVLAIGLLLFIRPATSGKPEVVVYTSVDWEFAEPLLQQFTQATGIEVNGRPDDEASKTTAMASRLRQMKGRPDGDVFWNSEKSFSEIFAREGLLEPYASPLAREIPSGFKDAQNYWTGFGCRARVLIYNTQRVKRTELPRTLEDLADPRWKGRFAIAKPVFGTTRSHLAALVERLGEEKAFKLFRAWHANGVVLAESNGDVRNRVADGWFDLGLTDSDDALSAMERNKPVDFIVPDQTSEWRGAFLIPNTVSILKNCPHHKEACALLDFLLRPETEIWLAEHGAHQIPVRPVAAKLPEALRNLQPAVSGNTIPIAATGDTTISGDTIPIAAQSGHVPGNSLPERIQRALAGEE